MSSQPTIQELDNVLLRLASRPTELKTRKELDIVLATYPAVCLDVFAEWCPPCRKLAQVFEKWEKQYSKVRFVKINSDNKEMFDYTNEANIENLPTVIVFKDRNVIAREQGFSPQMVSIVAKALDSF